MLSLIKRPFIIRTRFEALFIIYALALGAAENGAKNMSINTRAG